MDTPRLFFSKREVAQIIGISEITVHRLTKSGKLASARFGSRVMIPREALDHILSVAMGGGMPA